MSGPSWGQEGPLQEERPLPWKDWGLDRGEFLARVGPFAERGGDSMRPRTGEEGTCSSAHTYDLLSLGLRAKGRRAGQARAINTARRVGGGGAQVTQQLSLSELAQDTWPCLSLSPTPHPATIIAVALWVPSTLYRPPALSLISVTQCSPAIGVYLPVALSVCSSPNSLGLSLSLSFSL